MKDSFTPSDLNAVLVRELIKEKRSDRRWKNFRFFIVLLIIIFLMWSFSGTNEMTTLYGEGGKGYVALIQLEGNIGSGESFSADQVIPQLKSAFSDREAKGVILDIDSGGGSPVQSAIIHDAILGFKKKYHKEVIVVGEDTLASGAYYVAVSADKIYVNPNTITGSIGVAMKGFGFPELLKKVGIERRVYISGSNKDRLDMFLPQTKEDQDKVNSIINEVHQNFNQVVLEGRKGKLTAPPESLFTGDFWSGQSALKLGLVDGLGNVSDVMQKEFKVNHYKDYSRASSSLLKSLVGPIGSSLGLNDKHIKMSAEI